MLASLVPKPFDRPGWVYEEKYDGYRILAYKEGAKVTLLSRNQHDRTATFAVVADAVGQLPDRTLLLDGEVVAFDSKGVSRFQLLQRGDVPQHYAVFDCLYRDGRDLRSEPLSRRREEAGSRACEAVGATPRLAPSGEERSYRLQHRQAQRLRRGGRQGQRCALRRAPLQKMAQGQGASGGRVRHRRIYGARRQSRNISARCCSAPTAAKICTMSARSARVSLSRRWRNSQRRFDHTFAQVPPFVDPPREKNVTWLAPRLVAQIAFQEWTADRKLRQPVFLGLRDDKKPTEVVLPENL